MAHRFRVCSPPVEDQHSDASTYVRVTTTTRNSSSRVQRQPRPPGGICTEVHIPIHIHRSFQKNFKRRTEEMVPVSDFSGHAVPQLLDSAMVA